jgi:hypothetical protein
VGNTGAMFVKIKIRQGLYRYLTVFCFDLTPQAEVPDDKILGNDESDSKTGTLSQCSMTAVQDK